MKRFCTLRIRREKKGKTIPIVDDRKSTLMLRIGSRSSILAMEQSGWIKSKLEERFEDLQVSVTKIKTTGDMILDVPLGQVGGKGLFVKEIEEALLRHEVDLAVHSMKDVPTFLPDGLHLGAITEREDPRDVLISKDGRLFRELRQKARIGTSSLRRQAQLLHLRPDLEVVQLRGNLDTRIRKLSGEGLDGIILAAAGLKRMGWLGKITEYLPFEVSLPAVGQGALGIECRVTDGVINRKLECLDHPTTRYCVLGERAFLRRLEGGCQVPIAAHGQLENGRLKLSGLVSSVDGMRLIRKDTEGLPEEAEEMGKHLAECLISDGADTILKEIRPTKKPMGLDG
jgi:hydroxymethylbilane synthase